MNHIVTLLFSILLQIQVDTIEADVDLCDSNTKYVYQNLYSPLFLKFMDTGIHIEDSRTKLIVDEKYNISKIVKESDNLVSIHFKNGNKIIVHLDSGKRAIIFSHHVQKDYKVEYPIVVAPKKKNEECGCEQILKKLQSTKVDISQCECESEKIDDKVAVKDHNKKMKKLEDKINKENKINIDKNDKNIDLQKIASEEAFKIINELDVPKDSWIGLNRIKSEKILPEDTDLKHPERPIPEYSVNSWINVNRINTENVNEFNKDNNIKQDKEKQKSLDKNIKPTPKDDDEPQEYNVDRWTPVYYPTNLYIEKQVFVGKSKIEAKLWCDSKQQIYGMDKKLVGDLSYISWRHNDNVFILTNTNTLDGNALMHLLNSRKVCCFRMIKMYGDYFLFIQEKHLNYNPFYANKMQKRQHIIEDDFEESEGTCADEQKVDKKEVTKELINKQLKQLGISLSATELEQEIDANKCIQCKNKEGIKALHKQEEDIQAKKDLNEEKKLLNEANKNEDLQDMNDGNDGCDAKNKENNKDDQGNDCEKENNNDNKIDNKNKQESNKKLKKDNQEINSDEDSDKEVKDNKSNSNGDINNKNKLNTQPNNPKKDESNKNDEYECDKDNDNGDSNCNDEYEMQQTNPKNIAQPRQGSNTHDDAQPNILNSNKSNNKMQDGSMQAVNSAASSIGPSIPASESCTSQFNKPCQNWSFIKDISLCSGKDFELKCIKIINNDIYVRYLDKIQNRMKFMRIHNGTKHQMHRLDFEKALERNMDAETRQNLAKKEMLSTSEVKQQQQYQQDMDQEYSQFKNNKQNRKENEEYSEYYEDNSDGYYSAK